MIKLNTFIEIVSTISRKDSEGFVTHGDTVLASIRAYFEPKNTTEKWANMAQFATATAIFKFRKIPGVTVDSTLVIVKGGERYNILSVEDNRMYITVVAEEVKPSG